MRKVHSSRPFFLLLLAVLVALPTGAFGPEWTPLPTAEDGLVEVASIIAGIDASHDGTYGAVLGRSAQGDFTTNALDLFLDLEGETQVELSFWVKDVFDNTHSVDGLYFSHDRGVSFTKVYDFAPDDWTDHAYGRLPPIDVDRLAADHGLSLNDHFVIRFQQYGYDDFDGDGLMIDDVSVFVP